MGTYFEAGVGKAEEGSSYDMGLHAASDALGKLDRFDPILAFVFVSPEFNVHEVHRGVGKVLGDCPLIGASTCGEIADGLIIRGVAVSLLASPHIRVRVGIGQGVSRNFEKAVQEALKDTDISEYFSSQHPLQQTLRMSSAGAPGVSPALLIAFSPGVTKECRSLSHDIHTLLRKQSANRIPIFGGASGDYFRWESNYQIANAGVFTDSIALAFLESEILFGMGMAHGYLPTTKRALVTKATGHVVNELDGRPAAKVVGEILGVPLEEFVSRDFPLSKFPFGATDVYGNSLLNVPERVLGDGSIQFGTIMSTDQVITLMQGTDEDIVSAGRSAYEKAIRQGGLGKPALALMLSCSLRIADGREKAEVKRIREKSNIPMCGFFSFGEKGLSDDGLPVFGNQSVSMLVFSDELNPVASLILKGKSVYQEFTSQLKRKESQIESIGRINQIIKDGTDVGRLLSALTTELTGLFPWAQGAFYLSTDESKTYALASASDLDQFPSRMQIDEESPGSTKIMLDSHGKRFGSLVFKQKDGASAPEEEDLVLAETIAGLTASGLQRIETDGRLNLKLQQLEIINQLGTELSKTDGTSSQSQTILKHMREILKLSFASLWFVDRTHQLLTKEAMDGDDDFEIGQVEKENDERLARWQIENQQPLFFTNEGDDQQPIVLIPPFPFSFVSLPIVYKGQTRGILNLYSSLQYKWSLQNEPILENMEFLQNISTQIAIFIANRSIHKHATFYKEMHHRVKNNLQNIASLLRMQLRRLDRVSAEQALSDSISRIMSIALVHETLSQGEIGMVDLGRLVGSISKLPETDAPERPVITLDVSGSQVFIPSREATSLALVINELVQNAVQHGKREKGRGKLSIQVEKLNGTVSVLVQDNGPGLPEDFDMGRDSNLGLTIVRTLVKDELKGHFEMGGTKGTDAKVTFPYPESYLPIE